MPTGTPPVAKLDESFDYGKVLTDASHVLPQNEQCAALRDEWRAFTAARPSTNERAADFVTPWVFVPVPRLAPPVQTAQRIAGDQALIYEQSRTIRSSIYNGAEGNLGRQQRAIARENADSVVLVAGSAVLITNVDPAAPNLQRFSVGELKSVSRSGKATVAWRSPDFTEDDAAAKGNTVFRMPPPQSQLYRESKHTADELSTGIVLTPTGFVSNVAAGAHREYFRRVVADCLARHSRGEL